MWLTILVDRIAIALGVAIILVAADNRSSNAAEHRACHRSGRGANSRKNRSCKSAGAGTNCRSSGGAGYRMIVSGSGRTATERETADGSSRD